MTVAQGKRYESIRRYIIDPNTGCWNWFASTTEHPYAKFTIYHKTYLAHRYFYEFYFGKIPVGLQIDHLCKNTLCVNPYHMEAVTPRENQMRSNSVSGTNARKKICIQGHLLEGANLYITWDGRRQCRSCRKKASNNYYKRRQICHS